MCHAHVICTVKYFPNHYWLTALQPFPPCDNKPDGCEKQTEKELALRGVCVCVCVCVWFIDPPLVSLVLSLITFVATIHAHLASIWTHVALHALHSRLAGTQTRHLLAVVSDWTRGVAVTCCHRDNDRKRDKNIPIYIVYKVCLRRP